MIVSISSLWWFLYKSYYFLRLSCTFFISNLKAASCYFLFPPSICNSFMRVLNCCYMLICSPLIDYSFLRNSFLTATKFINKKNTIHIVEPGLILQFIGLLFLLMNAFHNVEVFSDFLLGPDSLLMLVH